MLLARLLHITLRRQRDPGDAHIIAKRIEYLSFMPDGLLSTEVRLTGKARAIRPKWFCKWADFHRVGALPPLRRPPFCAAHPMQPALYRLYFPEPVPEIRAIISGRPWRTPSF